MLDQLKCSVLKTRLLEALQLNIELEASTNAAPFMLIRRNLVPSLKLLTDYVDQQTALEASRSPQPASVPAVPVPKSPAKGDQSWT